MCTLERVPCRCRTPARKYAIQPTRALRVASVSATIAASKPRPAITRKRCSVRGAGRVLIGSVEREPADVDAPVATGQRDADRRLRVGERDVEVAREEVPRAHRHEAHRDPAADERLGHRPDRAVAAHRDDDVRPSADRLAGLTDARVVGGGLEPDRLGKVAVLAGGAHRVAQAGDVGLGRVRDECDQVAPLLHLVDEVPGRRRRLQVARGCQDQPALATEDDDGEDQRGGGDRGHERDEDALRGHGAHGRR